MTILTPIGARLQITLDAEYFRMQNEWFFKWHYIGGDNIVDIDGFDGRRIRYGGVKFSGSPRAAYWNAVQLYARQKLGELFDALEVELPKYPIEIRARALSEAPSLISLFVRKIRKAAVEKDRILRETGSRFRLRRTLGVGLGCKLRTSSRVR